MSPSKRISWKILLLVGIVLVLIGNYFIFFRPTLLPEDRRFLKIEDSNELTLLLKPWLNHVFRVLGGYTTAAGILVIHLAQGEFRALKTEAIFTATLAGLTSIAVMTWTNFQIQSDFRWPLIALAILWALAIALAVYENRDQIIFNNLQKI